MKKISKRLISLQLIIAMICTFIPITASAAAINIGDYVQMGTYYGKPILWRCVDIDENGPLMLSDKIICIKAFDAEYSKNNTTGSHSRNSYRQSYESNYWGDSNIRSWLNSTASAGNVNWLCGNPPVAEQLWNGYNAYDKEAGFLTNFTQSELNSIKTVTQKSILSYPEIDAGMATTGTEKHEYNYYIDKVVQNYDNAYAEYISDRLFLLDVKQVNKVYNNGNILGNDYYIGEPTAECVANSEYKSSSLAVGKKWRYWLRSPNSYDDDSVRYVYSDGGVDYSVAFSGDVGVRPAFYLNLPSFSVTSGAGTESNPYVGYGSSSGEDNGENDGNSGNDENSNSNSTSENAPIINSAKIAYNGNTYNLFSDTLNVVKDSEITTAIEASVNNNGCNNVKVYITQGTGGEIDITGVCKDIQPGKVFSASKTIYIIAVDTDTGKSTSKATKLKIASPASVSAGADSGVDGLNFKLGKDIGFTIPDSVPVFGGTDIKWKFDFIPITFEYDREDDNKLNVVIGGNIVSEEYTKNGVKYKYFKNFDFKKYKKAISHAARTQKHSLSELRSYFDKDNRIKKTMNLFGGNVSGSGKGNSGGDIDFMGYAEMKYIDGQWKFIEGVVKLDAEIKYTYEGQVFIWVVPCYYEFGGGIGAGFEGKMIDLNPDGFTPQFEGYLSAKVMAEIGGGVGISGVATAGASGEGSLNIKTALMKKYIKSWGEGSASFNVKLFGKTVASKEFARGEFLIHETGNSKGLIPDNAVTLQSAESEDMYNIDIDAVYENESRAYAENPTVWLGEDEQINLLSADYTNKNLNKLAENIYTESKPQICEIDGVKVMVMQWDNTERADIDRAMLIYSVYDDETQKWSAPKPVADDGTADFYPCFNDGYLVWQNEQTTLTDDMTLTDIAKLGEICVSKWDGAGFYAPTRVSSSRILNTLPYIAKNENGASVVWVTNTENDILGVTGSNSIMQSDFYDGSWHTPKSIKSNINAVTNITAGNINNKFCIAYVCDDDNNLNTINDRDIRIICDGAETQLTDNDILDSNPVFAGNKIYYYSNGNIVYSDIDGTNKNVVFDDVKAGLTDTFVADSNANGDVAVWWTKAENNGAEVYASLYTDNEWSDEIKITDIGNRAKYPSGILNDDGSMTVAFNNGMESENVITRTDLYTISVNPSYDIVLTDAYFDEDNMKAYATVKNGGELAIEQYTVTLADNSMTVTEPLKAGESAEIEIEYKKDGNLTLHEAVLSVAVIGNEEYNTDNNSARFEIGHADINVENVAINEDETVVSADVSNIGYSNAGKVSVKLHEENTDGAVIAEKTISLSAGGKQTVEFAVDKSAMSFLDSSKTLYVTAQTESEEISLGNNDGYTVLTAVNGLPDYRINILNYGKAENQYVINSVAENNTENTAECTFYSAVYSADGILKGCGIVDAQMAENSNIGVDIAVSCDIEDGDIIKSFMWTDDMSVLAKAAEITIIAK